MSTADDMQGLAGMMAMFPKMMGTVTRRDRLAFLQNVISSLCHGGPPPEMYEGVFTDEARGRNMAALAVAERMIEGEAPMVDAPPVPPVALCSCGQPATIDNLCAACFTAAT